MLIDIVISSPGYRGFMASLLQPGHRAATRVIAPLPAAPPRHRRHLRRDQHQQHILFIYILNRDFWKLHFAILLL